VSLNLYEYTYVCKKEIKLCFLLYAADCEDGQVKLVTNAVSEYAKEYYNHLGGLDEDGVVKVIWAPEELWGRIEVCLNRRWGTIHVDSHTSSHRKKLAQVVCRQLGYSPTCEYCTCRILGYTITFTKRRNFC